MKSKKGYEMPISVIMLIVLGLVFLSIYWGVITGFFEQASERVFGLMEVSGN